MDVSRRDVAEALVPSRAVATGGSPPSTRQPSLAGWSAQRARDESPGSGRSPVNSVVALQRTAGNRATARAIAVLQRQPTFGNLFPEDVPDPDAEVVRLEKVAGKWREIRGRFNHTARGTYSFVVRDGRLWAVKGAGHTEAAEGDRVTWAGEAKFEAGVLKGWNDRSGHVRPAASEPAEKFRKTAIDAGLDKELFNRHPDNLKRPRPTGAKGPQLPVEQPATRPRTPGEPAKVGPGPPRLGELEPRRRPNPQEVGGEPVAPIGGGQSSASTAESEPTTARATAKFVAEGQARVARWNQLVERLQTYWKLYSALEHALALLSAIDSMTKLLAHGTGMPEEQAKADATLKASQDAKDEAETETQDISWFDWTVTIGEAVRRKDSKTVFELDSSLIKLHNALDAAARGYENLSESLARQLKPLMDARLEQLIQIVTPNTSGSENNAVAFALHNSLEKLHNTIESASQIYSEAAEILRQESTQLTRIETLANDMGWDIAQAKARVEYEHQQHRREIEDKRERSSVEQFIKTHPEFAPPSTNQSGAGGDALEDLDNALAGTPRS